MYRKSKHAFTLLIALAMISLLAVPAMADRGPGPDSGEERREADDTALEVEVDRDLVMLGDDIEVEAEFEVESDVESEEEESDDEPDEASTEEPEEESVEDTDEGSDETEEEVDRPDPVGDDAVEDQQLDATADDTSDTVADDADDEAVSDDESEDSAGDPVPTAVEFAVDYGDGTTDTLTVEESEAGADEFEAEAAGSHTYGSVGTYVVTVTATPDVGTAETVVVDVEVIDEPVPHTRDTDLVCPEDLRPSHKFDDVDGTSVHDRAIACLATRGAVKGVGNGAFAPDDSVTRAQIASMIVGILEDAGVEIPEGAEDHFGDDDTSVHQDAIDALAELGLVSGSGGASFNPDAPLTRGQLANLLVRAYEHAAGDDVRADLDYFEDDAASVHQTAINEAAAAGFTSGKSRGHFAPDDDVTRAQLATFLARVLDLLTESGTSTG